MADEIKVGSPCERCATPYDECTELLRNGSKACCGSCYSTDTHRERTITMDPERQKVLDRLQPFVTPRYPTPWQVAETNAHGRVIVTCATGHYACEAATPEAAEAIVMAVNEFARRDWADG